MEPLKLCSVKKQIIWGGERLAREYGKGILGEKIAESWELADRPDGTCTICGGAYDGKPLSEYLAVHRDEVFAGWNGDRFPLLIKLIDAADDLSIQVHPDDEYAAAHTDDLGKTEMWYIVDAAPDAKIIYGLKRHYTTEELRVGIAAGTLEQMMNYIPVKKGEVYFIPSGTVHAICRGLLIAEIQQNSNITYRVYDYNRRGADGKLRALHVEDALAVIEKIPEPLSRRAESDPAQGMLAKCGFFTVYHKVGAFSMTAGTESFVHLLCLDGSATLEWREGKMSVRKGESVFIPAGLGNFSMSDGADIIVSAL